MPVSFALKWHIWNDWEIFVSSNRLEITVCKLQPLYPYGNDHFKRPLIHMVYESACYDNSSAAWNVLSSKHVRKWERMKKKGKHTFIWIHDQMGQTFYSKDVSAKRATCCYYLLNVAKFMANHIHFVIYFGFHSKGFAKNGAAKGYLALANAKHFC